MRIQSKIENYNDIRASSFKLRASLCFFVLVLLSWFSSAQVTSSIDSTAIKIGEQITYRIAVEADSIDLVIFPEGQTFLPLEMVESFKPDTTKNNAKYNLIKEYALTQFDSGAYIIPRQKIVVGSKTFFTDSLKVEVNNILIDTTKQGLYDIKPLIEVDKSAGNWWKYLLYALVFLALIGGLLYWFIWRKKPLTQEEKIALLSPYQRAKLSLKKLDDANYLANEELKDYYSELTGIIRTYLDEKVYDHALESTTDELVDRLNLLKDGNQIDLKESDIKNIETILKRADLVKFAKSKPDIALAEIDRKTIDLEIDQVKEALPEPTEEEKLRDQQYREEQERKKKRRKTIITVVIAAFLIIGSLIGLTAYYGYNTLKDNILGHPSKELLEGEWVRSEYGAPGVTISTPKVLKRIEVPLAKELQGQFDMTSFSYGSILELFSITSNTFNYKQEVEIDLEKAVEGTISDFEKKGAQNLVVQNDKFVTPNGAEGLKTYGTGEFPISGTDKFVLANYTTLVFTAQNVLQQVVILHRNDDTYAKEMTDRIINSIELKKDDKPAPADAQSANENNKS
jgi:hypothetical protein